jgi:hypothetical protein
LAKLFVTVQDEKGTERHKTAKQELEVNIFYGNAEDSRLALKIYVKAQQDPFSFPSIFIEDGRQVKPIIAHC